ncbi:MAG TPA: hypothetical protein PLI70_07260 [Gemmatimonadales bacterium]|nr:hypothetical protein [Gemmatimonadales bacterium]HRZ09235.1 hypothetical protein [Gemmatimonadales bacterium]
MNCPNDPFDARHPNRRQAIRLLAGGIAALAASACTPATIILKSYPEQYGRGTAATRRTLHAFTATVIPGLTPDEILAVDALEDPFYPTAKYCAFLASDLDRRAGRRHDRLFFELDLPKRTAIITKALDEGDATTRKLYTGAVFLTQAAVYGGIHDDSAGCRLTGFPGGNHLADPALVSYPDTSRFAARALSRDGNPA